MKVLTQDHKVLARRLRKMANAIYSMNKPSDDKLKAARDFEKSAEEHEQALAISKRRKFIMML